MFYHCILVFAAAVKATIVRPKAPVRTTVCLQDGTILAGNHREIFMNDYQGLVERELNSP